MKPTPQQTEKDPGKDQKTYDQLPVKTQEIFNLKNQAEKSTGQENLDFQKAIRKHGEDMPEI